MKFTKVEVLEPCPELAYFEGDIGLILTSKVSRLEKAGYVVKIVDKSPPPAFKAPKRRTKRPLKIK